MKGHNFHGTCIPPSLFQLECPESMHGAFAGDSYMVASNLMAKHPEHAAEMIRFALRAREEASKVPCPDATDGSCLKMRIGEKWDW